MKRAVIAGAGVAGLATALKLHEAGWSVTILEAAPEPGGAAQTMVRNGFLLEAGPDSFITTKPEAVELCRRLGLESDLIGVSGEHRRSFIARDGRLYPTPDGFYLLAPTKWAPFATTPLLSPLGKLRAALDLVLPARKESGDETLASFVRRRFGQEALDHLAQPMVAGIYTADAEQLSLAATFPDFLKMEASHRSVILALRARRGAPGGAATTASGPRYGLFATLRKGVSTLVQAMVDHLPAGTVRTGTRVAGVARSPAGWTVSVDGAPAETADAVCLALPAAAAAAALGSTDPGLSDELKAIPCASPVTVNLAYQRPHVRHALDGFGFVVPAVEQRPLLACTFSSVKFAGRAPDGAVLLRAFLGGALHPEMAGWSDADLAGMAHEELKGYLAILGEPMFAEVHRHPGSMPQYHLGHLDRVARIRARVRALPGLALAGNAYDGIGLPDCIRSGEAAAAALLA